MTSRVWLITGTSSGLGRFLTESVLARGDKVIPTARTNSIHKLDDLKSENCHPLELDVADSFENVQVQANAAISIWGHVDVIVNNAGHGAAGTVEEVGVDGLIQQYQTNVFGVVNVTNAFLPHMRARKAGTIVVIGSRSAWRDRVPLLAFYGSSKAAIRSITESLTAEVEAFGIRTLLVEPGGMKTNNWTNLVKLQAREEFSDYEPIRTKAFGWMEDQRDSQPSDARKIGEVIVDVVRGEGVAAGKDWPDWLILGEDAEHDVRTKCQKVLDNLGKWKDVTLGVGLDK